MQIGDVYKNKKTGRLATLIFIGNMSGIHFLEYNDDGHRVGLPTVILNEHWEKQ